MGNEILKGFLELGLQQNNVIILNNIMFISLFICFIICTLILHIKWNKKDENGYSLYELHDGMILVISFLGLLSIFFGIIGICLMNEMLTIAINPEYQAIKNLVNIF